MLEDTTTLSVKTRQVVPLGTPDYEPYSPQPIGNTSNDAAIATPSR
jgi:hypothetical protein